MRRWVWCALAGLGAAAVVGCAVNPATGKREFMLVSESDEIAMGKQYDQQLVAEMGMYADTALADYVRTLGRRLAALSERPQLAWEFRLVDDPAVNAFAVPGGYIYITRGIMANMGSEGQLVSVLGHEIGHVTARHTAQQITQQQLFGLGLGIGAIFAPEIAGMASGAVQILFLKFSRDDESQADELGFRYMRAARYDPREAADMFAQLARVSGGGGRLPEWQSTHPDPVNRRAKALERAATIPDAELTAMAVERDTYLQRLDGMMFGPDPREGFFIDTRFLHPDLAFELTFPAGWQTVNQRQVVAAINGDKDAVITLTGADGATPAEAARAFFAREGVSGSAQATTVNGLAASGGAFTAQTGDGILAGEVQFIQHRQVVFRIMGYGGQANWSARRDAVRRAMGTFKPLTEQRMLAVQPWYLDIVRVDRTMTPADFAQRYPAPVSADEVALLNQVDAGGRFLNRNLVKRVVGQPLPR